MVMSLSGAVGRYPRALCGRVPGGFLRTPLVVGALHVEPRLFRRTVDDEQHHQCLEAACTVEGADADIPTSRWC